MKAFQLQGIRGAGNGCTSPAPQGWDSYNSVLSSVQTEQKPTDTRESYLKAADLLSAVSNSWH